jgi:hypothetical protein
VVQTVVSPQQSAPMGLQDGVQTLLTQLSAVQQSELVEHAPPVSTQGAVQMLFVHKEAPQHVAEFEHGPNAVQGAVQTLFTQVSEPQQSEVDSQESPVAVQLLALHLPATHVFDSQQSKVD